MGFASGLVCFIFFAFISGSLVCPSQDLSTFIGKSN